MPAVAHWQLPPFRLLKLEESFVLAVREVENEIRFDMELVLGERHPSYRPPRPGQEHCYRKGRMIFRGVTNVRWTNKRIERADDADDAGDAGDLGKIDSFVLDAGTYKLRGPWGRLELEASSVDVDLW